MMDGRKKGLMDGRIEGWMYGWADGWMDGRTDGWMDRRTGGWIGWNKLQFTPDNLITDRKSMSFICFGSISINVISAVDETIVMRFWTLITLRKFKCQMSGWMLFWVLSWATVFCPKLECRMSHSLMSNTSSGVRFVSNFFLVIKFPWDLQSKKR